MKRPLDDEKYAQSSRSRMISHGLRSDNMLRLSESEMLAKRNVTAFGKGWLRYSRETKQDRGDRCIRIRL
jgi:hypothetical protein